LKILMFTKARINRRGYELKKFLEPTREIL
jgi:hypothetical protein